MPIAWKRTTCQLNLKKHSIVLSKNHLNNKCDKNTTSNAQFESRSSQHSQLPPPRRNHCAFEVKYRSGRLLLRSLYLESNRAAVTGYRAIRVRKRDELLELFYPWRVIRRDDALALLLFLCLLLESLKKGSIVWKSRSSLIELFSSSQSDSRYTRDLQTLCFSEIN